MILLTFSRICLAKNEFFINIFQVSRYAIQALAIQYGVSWAVYRDESCIVINRGTLVNLDYLLMILRNLK